MNDIEDEEILTYVKRQGLVRWTDMVNEFEKARKWNHSKFIKHWKNIKTYLEKVPNPETGRHLYKIKNKFGDIALKAFYRSEISQGNFNEIHIPMERFEKVAEFITGKSFEIMRQASERAFKGMKAADEQVTKGNIEYTIPGEEGAYDSAEQVFFKSVAKTRKELLRKIKKKRFIEKLKEFLKPTDFSESQIELTSIIIPLMFEKMLIGRRKKDELMKIFEKVRIQVICSPGETMPHLTDEDISSVFNILISKAIDKNKGTFRTKPFHIIASFPVN